MSLKKQIEELERRVKELEARPIVYQPIYYPVPQPYYVPPPVPYYPQPWLPVQPWGVQITWGGGEPSSTTGGTSVATT